MELDKNLIGGSTRLLLLSLLSESDRYGYDIIRTLAEWVLERPTRAERRAMKRAAAQIPGGTTM